MLERRIFWITSILFAFGLIFLAGLYSGIRENFAFHFFKGIRDDIKAVLDDRSLRSLNQTPYDFLQPSRQSGVGVTINHSASDENALILLSGFFDKGNEVRLVQRDGQIAARWPVAFSDHFPDASHLTSPPASDWKIDLHGALINPDGSVVFNYEYGGTVKLSRCGEVLWTLAHPTHHSISQAQRGGYWIPGRRYHQSGAEGNIPPFAYLSAEGVLADDLLLLVSETGEIMMEKSVTDLLYENGHVALMTATGQSFEPEMSWDQELVHVNKVAELPEDFATAFPTLETGDLAVSIRQYNLLFVVDPDTWVIKWHQTGPWLRQHDPEFLADGSIVIFNNNLFIHWMLDGERSNPAAPRISNIMKINPRTGHSEIVYGMKPGQQLMSIIRGKVDPTPAGGWLITEFEAGRALEVDADGNAVWEYINRYDEDQVLEITEARRYGADYFTVENWDCP